MPPPFFARRGKGTVIACVLCLVALFSVVGQMREATLRTGWYASVPIPPAHPQASTPRLSAPTRKRVSLPPSSSMRPISETRKPNSSSAPSSSWCVPAALRRDTGMLTPNGSDVAALTRCSRLAPLSPSALCPVEGFDEPRVDALDADWLVVIGIPTVDNDVGFDRRRRQRASWLTYANVGRPCTRSNCRSLAGGLSVMHRYLVGRHPDNDYRFTRQAQEEYRERRDVIFLALKEGKPTTVKISGGGGHWGLAAEVGMSRKAAAWYALAVRYCGAHFVMKADDDSFIRTVPLSLHLQRFSTAAAVASWGGSEGGALANERRSADVVQKELERRNVSFPSPAAGVPGGVPSLYWGRGMRWQAVKNDPHSAFTFVGGMAVTMSAHLVQHFAQQLRLAAAEAPPATETPLGRRLTVFRLALREFVEGESARVEYKSVNMDHEDVMVGRWFYDQGALARPRSMPAALTAVSNRELAVATVSDCRFHDVHAGANQRLVGSDSLVVHHLRMHEYEQLRKRFVDDEVVDGALSGGLGDTAGGQRSRHEQQAVDAQIRQQGSPHASLLQWLRSEVAPYERRPSEFAVAADQAVRGQDWLEVIDTALLAIRAGGPSVNDRVRQVLLRRRGGTDQGAQLFKIC